MRKMRTRTCTRVFRTALFIISKRCKQPKCPTTGSMNETKVEYAYYLAIKRKMILTHATTWTNLEDIMVSQGSQSEETTYYIIPFM